jgi:hypothetical protein
MSNTRHRKDGEPTQQGFCSSAEYERGLLANIVAMRCGLLESAEERALVFSLQYHSWQPGGLEKLAGALLKRFPDRAVTPSMNKFGTKPGTVYSASQVKAIRTEIPGGEFDFLLSGENSLHDAMALPEMPTSYEEMCGKGMSRKQVLEVHRAAARRADAQPHSYPAEVFCQHCRDANNGLSDYIIRLCADAESKFESPWYFPTLISSLREYLSEEAGRRRSKTADTEIVRMIDDALDYTLQSGELTPIQGLARIGKTHAVKAWCERHPGQARYVQVPPTNDDASFIRRIAEAYGVSSGLSFKNTQIRERVERTARAARLMLVFDEAHWLLTQDYRARKRPSRIAWIMNELVNYGVPVALVTTPQFEEDKLRIKERTGWNWDQFDGRIGEPVTLPPEISQDDLAAIARAHIPKEDFDPKNYQKAIDGLVGYAMFTKSQVAGIEHVVKRARFDAAKHDRKVTWDDIRTAVKRRMPVDPEAREGKPAKTPSRAVIPTLATDNPRINLGEMQPDCRVDATPANLQF